ncbi:MAG: fasciclin domain-containing protein [Synechococcales cyanobacterium C42_A2020_086]|nr:fasciclin domain-containing protein [Synechococcales cyanobacterium M58_A2018_015]MBF2073218.1 fasciclin domain-containing protein [Synechococcales cyanobacterium C42_A2020_086]
MPETSSELEAPSPDLSETPEAPAEITETTPVAPQPTADTPAQPSNLAAASGTIVEIASANETFSTLVAALTEAELAEVLGSEGPFTVFAPTNEAFAALPEGTVEELLKPENRETLVQVLKYHVVPGTYLSSSLSSGEVETAAGEPLTITVSEDAVTVNNATVIQPDIVATNGVIHAVDQVILPPQ